MPPTLAMCLGKVMLRCRHKLTPKFQWPHSRVAFGSLTWQSNVGVPGWPCDFPPGGDSGTLASSILWSHHLPVPRGLSYVQRTGSTWRNHMCLLKPLSWEVIISTRLVRISHTHIVCLDERRAGDIPHWAVDCQKKKNTTTLFYREEQRRASHLSISIPQRPSSLPSSSLLSK